MLRKIALSLKVIFLSFVLWIIYVVITPLIATYQAVKNTYKELRKLWTGFYDGVLNAKKKKSL